MTKAGTDPQTGQTNAAMQGVTVANIPAPQIRRLETPDAALYRDIRPEALQRNPEAFRITFEWEDAQPLHGSKLRLAVLPSSARSVTARLPEWRDLPRRKIRSRHIRRCCGACMCEPPTVTRVLEKGSSRRCDHARGRVTVVSENEAARRLYHAMGFVEYGYEKRALKQGGRYYDDVLNFLDEGLR